MELNDKSQIATLKQYQYACIIFLISQVMMKIVKIVNVMIGDIVYLHVYARIDAL